MWLSVIEERCREVERIAEALELKTAADRGEGMGQRWGLWRGARLRASLGHPVYPVYASEVDAADPADRAWPTVEERSMGRSLTMRIAFGTFAVRYLSRQSGCGCPILVRTIWYNCWYRARAAPAHVSR